MQGEFYRVFFLDSSRGSIRIRNLGKDFQYGLTNSDVTEAPTKFI